MDGSNTPMGIASKMRAGEGTSSFLQHKIVSIDQQTCRIQMAVTPLLANGFELLHGGITFTLADTAAAYLACANKREHVTASASISFLKAARVGDMVTATAIIVLRQDRDTIIDVQIDAGKSVIATANFHMKQLAVKDPAAI